MGFEGPATSAPISREQQLLAAEEQAQAADKLHADSLEKNRNLIEAAIHKTVGALGFSESETRNSAEATAAEFVKSVPLFIGGKRGLALSTLAFGLGEVKVNHALPEQGVELAAGLGKGFLTKSVFDVFGKKDWNFVQKGMAMGSSSRLIETGLTPQNYMVNGQFDFGRGASRALLNAGDAKALAVDVATFGAAHFIPGAVSGKMARSALFTTTLTGGTFGFTSGTLGELQQQWHDKQPLNLTKLFTAGAREGLLMSAAAATGHALTPRSLLIAPKEKLDGTGTNGAGQPAAVRGSDAVLASTLISPVVPIVEAKTAEAQKGRENKAPSDQGNEKRPDVTPAKEAYGYAGYFLKDASIGRTQNSLVINGENVPVRWKPPETLHITDTFGIKQSVGDAWVQQNASNPPKIRVLGLAVDAKGLEALHVSVNGQPLRADGKPYHVTRSLDTGRRANESMTVVQKALAVDKARSTGTTSDIKAEDLERYSYRALKPEEQFDLEFAPRFAETETTAPKEKVSKPKVEVPYETLAPKMQVITAMKNTPQDALERIISTRTPEHRLGSYFDLTPDQLKQALFRANWEPYSPVGADGKPLIAGGARGYRATIEGGRLGMTNIESIPADAPLYLVDVKGLGKWSIATAGAEAPKSNHVTMIVAEGEAGKPVVWTFHPGEPVRPSALDSARLNEALANSGIDISRLPEKGEERQIPVTREQLARINSLLPPESQMTMAKLEDAINIPAASSEPVKEIRTPGLEALDALPNQSDRLKFQAVFSTLPETLRAQYTAKLNETIKNPEVVARTTQVRGIVHEMNRVQRIMQQGLETIGANPVITEPIQYTGYNRKATDFSEPPNHRLKATIASDVPIVREDGKPYIYELNSSPRRLYGNDAQQRNQILKFQEAVDKGVVSGATVEINGRISPEFVQWLNGKVVGDKSPAPNVEVLYNMTLPSGGDYTFILKRAAGNEGLRFKNSDREFSPEDRKVINGIYKAIQDRSIGEFISGTNIDSPPPALAPYLADPFQIKDLNLFNQYDQLRLQSTWDKLTAKADSDRINAENPRNALSQYNTREYIDEATRWYQNHLKQNPQTAKAKSAYVIKNEAGIEKVVDLAYERAQQIKQYESERQTSAGEIERQKERQALGYTGRPEGISLDMEHIIMDATQENNKGGNRRGRSYDQPERFSSVEQVMDYMKGQDRLQTDVQVFDPLTGKTDVQANVSEKQIGQRASKVQAENIERARQRVEQYEQRYQELKDKQTRTPEEDSELRFLNSRHGGLKVHKAAIEKAQTLIDEITRVRKNSDGPPLNSIPQEKRAAYIQEMKAKSAQYDKQIETARQEMEDRYKQILGGDAEWDKLAMRMNVQDQNIMKFVYVVDGEGNIPVTEEILRGDAAGRAAHSELARGRNVYGAGELVFAKDSATGQWVLVEINNASGHYRPPGADTLLYVKNLIAQKGIDTSRAIINDALQRGTPLVDAHFLDVGDGQPAAPARK